MSPKIIVGIRLLRKTEQGSGGWIVTRTDSVNARWPQYATRKAALAQARFIVNLAPELRELDPILKVEF